MTADYKDSPSNTDKLPVPVQMQLPEKLESFFAIFIAFLKSPLYFQQFQRKDGRHGSSIPEVIHSERHVYFHT